MRGKSTTKRNNKWEDENIWKGNSTTSETDSTTGEESGFGVDWFGFGTGRRRTATSENAISPGGVALVCWASEGGHQPIIGKNSRNY